MRGLSLHQPWASLVAIGAKAWETRGRRVSYRGPLAIHAATTFDEDDREACWDLHFPEVLGPAGLVDYTNYSDVDRWGDERFDLTLGAIVAVATLADCVRTTDIHEHLSDQERAFGDYTPGRYAWKLTDVRRLPNPVPCRGMQGLWPVPPAVLGAINAQLVAEAAQ